MSAPNNNWGQNVLAGGVLLFLYFFWLWDDGGDFRPDLLAGAITAMSIGTRVSSWIKTGESRWWWQIPPEERRRIARKEK